MSMPYRNSNGEMIRISWNTDSLIRLDNVDYQYNDFSSADKDNKKLIKGMDKLFGLKKENFDLLMNNSLYPAYYLISYDDSKVYSDPVDLIKFGDAIIDEDTLTFGIDLQLYNNIIFMIGNSNQMTTFNGSRNLWYKVMEAYSILSDKNNRKLKYILENKYKYSEEKTEKYCEDLNNYLYSFYEDKINLLMNDENCYECFRYFSSLKKSAIHKKTYSDLNESFNNYLLDLLNRKTKEMYESGYCYDLFEDRFFAAEILDLPDLNNRKKDQIVQSLYGAYLDCINIRIENNDFVAAKNSYDIVEKNKKYFDYNQMRELEPFKDLIEKNYNKDPRVKKQNMVSKSYNLEDKVVMPLIVLSILIGIVAIIGCIVTSFKNSIWNTILITDVIIFVILLIVEKVIMNIQYGKRK